MRCEARIRGGGRCRNSAQAGHELCGVHVRTASRYQLDEQDVSHIDLPLTILGRLRTNADLRDAIQLCRDRKSAAVEAAQQQGDPQCKHRYEALARKYDKVFKRLRQLDGTAEWSKEKARLEQLVSRHQALTAQHEREKATMMAQHAKQEATLLQQAAAATQRAETLTATIFRVSQQCARGTSNCRKQVQTLQEAHSTVEEQMQQLSKELQTAQERNAVVTQQLKEKMAACEERLTSGEGNRKRCLQQYEDMKQQLAAAQQRKTEITQQAKEAATNKDRTISTLQAELQQKQAELKAAQATAQTREQELVQAYRQTKSAESAKIAELTQAHDQAQAELQRSQDAINALESRVQTAVKTSETQVANLIDLNTKLVARLKQAEVQAAKLPSYEQKVQQVQVADEKLKAALSVANERVTTLERDVDEARKQMAQLDQEGLLDNVLQIMTDRNIQCSSLLQRLQGVVRKPQHQQLLSDLVERYCKAASQVPERSFGAFSGLGGAGAGRTGSAATSKPKPMQKAVQQAENITFTTKELNQITAKAKASVGLVRVMVRVRCDTNPTKAFTAGEEKGNSVLRISTTNLKRPCKPDKGSKDDVIEIKRKKTNMFIFNDNTVADRGCDNDAAGAVALARRNQAFYKQGLESVFAPGVPLTIVAYGQSGAGKTTTINYLLSQVFAKFGAKVMAQARVSFIDIYKDKAIDLMLYKDETFDTPETRKNVDAVVRRRWLRKKYLGPLRLELQRMYQRQLTVPELIQHMTEAEKYTEAKNVVKDVAAALTEVYLTHPEQLDEEYVHGKKGRFIEQRLTVRSLRQVDVVSFENYGKLFEYATAIRPTTITPQNTDGSSRSHLIIRFQFNAPGMGAIHIVDLAGSEDYSGASVQSYMEELETQGIYVKNDVNQRNAYYTGVTQESVHINKGLKELSTFLRYMNDKKLGRKLKSASFIPQTELVRTLKDLQAFPQSGLTTLVAQFKSEDGADALVEAERTMAVLECLIPPDEDLDKLAAKAP